MVLMLMSACRGQWVEHGLVDLSHDTTLRAPAYKKRVRKG